MWYGIFSLANQNGATAVLGSTIRQVIHQATRVKRRNYAIYFEQFCSMKSGRNYEIPKRFSHLTVQNLIAWQDTPYKTFLA